MDPDGANQAPVVSGDARSPSWSPNGQQLLYFASVGGSSSATRIVRRNADGSAELPLTAGFFVDVNPAWSPDGQKIAWRRDIHSGSELWVMDASGANQRRLVLPVGVSRFTWSPDSRQLAVDAVQGLAGGVWLINSDGTEPRAFTPNCSDTGICTAPSTSGATWAPDGKRLAYLEAGLAGIRVKAREGSSTLTVAVPAACCTGVNALSWSPDGQAIAFKTSTLRPDGLANEGRTAVVPVADASPLLVSPPANDVGAPQWRP
jgi:Tol biopolymer transport system component